MLDESTVKFFIVWDEAKEEKRVKTSAGTINLIIFWADWKNKGVLNSENRIKDIYSKLMLKFSVIADLNS